MKISRLREVVVAICFVLLLSLVVAKVERNNEQQLAGAFRAADGDSLVLGKQRLRLVGIDAPELSQTCTRAGASWDCGRQARIALAERVSDRTTRCDGSGLDKYHRLLVTCRNAAGDINATMVLSGMAVAFGDYKSQEAEAKAAHHGIWSGTFVMPSEWRRREKSGHIEEPHESSLFQRLFGVE
jgi:endonuclease YncB( thermonuclease family)